MPSVQCEIVPKPSYLLKTEIHNLLSLIGDVIRVPRYIHTLSCYELLLLPVVCYTHYKYTARDILAVHMQIANGEVPY